jgi:hypothetical protein
MSNLRKITQIATRRFLASEAGMETMLWLRENTPGVSRGDSHSIAFDAGIAEGWKACLNKIAEITPVDALKDRSEDSSELLT